LEVGLVTAPDSEFAETIPRLLSHKGRDWDYHFVASLGGETGALESRFYLGILNGAPVANIMTLERHGLGILGHVFTQPANRLKGICRAIMAVQMEHFRGRGGRILTLGTGFESPPYWIYHSFGFRSLRRGFMRYEAPGSEDFAIEWFAPNDTRIVRAEWEHWPLVALMGSYAATDYLRSTAWRLHGCRCRDAVCRA